VLTKAALQDLAERVAVAFQSVVGQERKVKVVIRPYDPSRAGGCRSDGGTLRWCRQVTRRLSTPRTRNDARGPTDVVKVGVPAGARDQDSSEMASSSSGDVGPTANGALILRNGRPIS